jgi:nucleoside-diphosphate-sugar epimerase
MSTPPLTTTPETHVIFGAGQIGTPLATILRDRGHRVRLVRRAGGGPDGVEMRHGDAGDPAFATEAAAGARAVYHCMNPAYDAALWARELPRLADSLAAAAGRAGATLVVLDNLYMLGNTHGQPMNEDTPANPCSRKGEVRAQVAERLFAAHRRGDVRVVAGRAADFYGPGGTGTYFGDAFWPRVLAGKSAQVLSDPAVAHTYHHTHDVAAGLAALGAAPEDACGGWWMLPAAPAESTRAMIDRFAAVLGRPVAVERVPGLVLAAMGLFVPFMRELREMSYQFAEPFLVDDARFRARFAVAPTPLDAGARAMVEWARAHYPAGR